MEVSWDDLSASPEYKRAKLRLLKLAREHDRIPLSNEEFGAALRKVLSLEVRSARLLFPIGSSEENQRVCEIFRGSDALRHLAVQTDEREFAAFLPLLRSSTRLESFLLEDRKESFWVSYPKPDPGGVRAEIIEAALRLPTLRRLEIRSFISNQVVWLCRALRRRHKSGLPPLWELVVEVPRTVDSFPHAEFARSIPRGSVKRLTILCQALPQCLPRHYDGLEVFLYATRNHRMFDNSFNGDPSALDFWRSRCSLGGDWLFGQRGSLHKNPVAYEVTGFAWHSVHTNDWLPPPAGADLRRLRYFVPTVGENFPECVLKCPFRRQTFSNLRCLSIAVAFEHSFRETFLDLPHLVHLQLRGYVDPRILCRVPELRCLRLKNVWTRDYSQLMEAISALPKLTRLQPKICGKTFIDWSGLRSTSIRSLYSPKQSLFAVRPVSRPDWLPNLEFVCTGVLLVQGKSAIDDEYLAEWTSFCQERNIVLAFDYSKKSSELISFVRHGQNSLKIRFQAKAACRDSCFSRISPGDNHFDCPWVLGCRLDSLQSRCSNALPLELLESLPLDLFEEGKANRFPIVGIGK